MVGLHSRLIKREQISVAKILSCLLIGLFAWIGLMYTASQVLALTADDLPTTVTSSQQVRAAGLATNKRLVSTSDGTLHAFIHVGSVSINCDTGTTNNLVWLYSLDDGETWSCGTQIASNGNDVVSAVVDSSDNIHLVVSRVSPGAGNQTDVTYKKLAKGVGSSWTLGSSHIVLDGQNTVSGYGWSDIEIEGNNRIWIVARYFENSTSSYRVVAYYSNGLTPTSTANWTQSGSGLSGTGSSDAYFIPSIVRFGSSLGVVYTSQDNGGQLLWRDRSDSDDLGEWNEETVIVSSGVNTVAYTAVGDNNGIVHLAYFPTSPSSNPPDNAFYAHYDGESWSTPFQISESKGISLAIATDGTNVYVLYEDSPSGSNNLSGTLYYKKGVAPFASENFDSQGTKLSNTQGTLDTIWLYDNELTPAN